MNQHEASATSRPVEAEANGVSTSPHYILATSPPAEVQTRVLKYGDTFAIFDRYGDVEPGGLGEEGLYHDGTRFLSLSILAIQDKRPLFLSSTVREENDLLTVDLTNSDIPEKRTARGVNSGRSCPA